MATTIDQQVALDEALVPSTQKLRIGRRNFQLPSDIQSKESTLQVVYDVLRNSPFFRAFQVTTDVPEIYMLESNEMYYPRFTKVIIDYFMTRKPSIPRRNRINWHYVRDDVLFSAIKVVSRHHTTQQYGAILPIELTTDDIRNSKAYKEYYACATGEAAPKPKASARKKKGDSTSSTTPPTPTPITTVVSAPRLSAATKGKQPARATTPTELTDVERTEAEQLKIVLKRSRQETHISQQRGSGTDEGTEGDEQTKGREESEGDKTDESDDGSDDGNDDDDDETKPSIPRRNRVNWHYVRDDILPTDPSDVERTEAEQLKIVLRRSRHDTHISQQGGSGTDEGTGSEPGVPDVPSDDSDEEISWNSSDDEDVDAQETTEKEEDSFDPIPKTPKESEDDGNDEVEGLARKKGCRKKKRQMNFIMTVKFLEDNFSNIPGIVNQCMHQQMPEAVREAKILIDKMEENKSIQRSDEQRNLYKALVEAYDADKTILDTYRELTILKRRREDDDQEGPFAGSDRGSKRRKEGGEHASASTSSEPATESASRSTTGSQSRQLSASESAFAEEPMQTTCQMEEPSHPVFETGAEDQPIIQTTQHPEWFSQPRRPPIPDRDWNKSVPAAQGNAQSWI
nr:hypothetical protein [Tanacetum cinerariifolium]